jgi:hypothetical protein
VSSRVAAAEHEHLAHRRFGQPQQQPQRRRLARTVGTEEADDRAGAERERELVNGDEIPKRLVSELATTTASPASAATGGVAVRRCSSPRFVSA